MHQKVETNLEGNTRNQFLFKLSDGNNTTKDYEAYKVWVNIFLKHSKT